MFLMPLFVPVRIHKYTCVQNR